MTGVLWIEKKLKLSGLDSVSEEPTEHTQMLRVRHLNQLPTDAVTGFDKSRQDSDEFSTTEKSCTVCGG